jgi:ubiquinone/menaquinone biosynthesis C-methylase UbiE
MKFLDLKNISEQYMDLLNPTTTEKIIKAGQIAGLKPGDRVIDFGCGFGETLILWAERFGISGVGIDIRPYACERAVRCIAERGLSDRLEIACGDAAKYEFLPQSFTLAACIGATFIWDSFKDALHAMKEAVQAHGKLVIGEAFWLTDNVPDEFRTQQTMVQDEIVLLQGAREEGFDFEYVLHSSHDDWDRYEADNWHGLVRWIEANPDHAELLQVIDHLHESQDEYVNYGRKYFGWGLYVLNPVRY